jgi:hypothetical protein
VPSVVEAVAPLTTWVLTNLDIITTFGCILSIVAAWREPRSVIEPRQ